MPKSNLLFLKKTDENGYEKKEKRAVGFGA